MKFGYHVSSAAPFSDALIRAQEKKCECMQIFVNQPQRWQPQVIAESEINKFNELNKKLNINPVLIHGIYLTNLATHNTFFLKASMASLIDDMRKAAKLNALGVNFHVGSTKGRDFEECLPQITKAIKNILANSPEGPYLILENSAGAGNVIGNKFSELATIIKAINSPRIKITLDTAHAFESGYELSTEKGLENTLEEFDKTIGIKQLVCLHLNDSETSLKSKKDRHADIGAGFIGLEGFKRIINHPKLKNLPAILETPNIKGNSDIDNLSLVRSLVKK